MPGLWVAPFWVDEKSRLYAEHPEWIVKNAAGRADFMPMFHDRMIGVLDCTREEVLAWLRETFKKFVELGFVQFKLDFLIGECLWGNVFHDKTKTRCEAYRMGLGAIRDAIGDNLLLLGTGIAMASVGLADMARIACDSIHRWYYSPESKLYTEAASFPNIFRNIAARNWYNRVCWVNDPDAPMIRAGKDKRAQDNELTDNEIKMQLGIQAISGGMVMIGEDLAALPKNRLEWLSKIFHHSPNSPRILDMFERDVPGVYLQKITDSEHLLGIFNWKDETEMFVVTKDKLGPEFDLKGITDYWDIGRVMEFDDGIISLNLPAHTCEIFILKALQ
jgi:alpha-galactosidase